MSRTEILCDHCGADLTYTGNCEDYRIVVRSQAKAPWYTKDGLGGGVVTAMAIPDPVPLPLDFCDFRCLKAWAVA